MIIETEGAALVDDDKDVDLFFNGDESVAVHFEDGRILYVDRYGAYTVMWNEKQLDSGILGV